MASSRNLMLMPQAPHALLPLNFHDSYDQHIKKIFDASATPPQLRLPRSRSQGMAALGDPSMLKELLQPVLGDGIEISLSDADVSSRACTVDYQVENSTKSGQMIVSFTRCLNIHDAKDIMRSQIGGYTIDISQMAERANIGSHSLRTPQGVFWVRDATFTNVYTDTKGTRSLLNS